MSRSTCALNVLTLVCCACGHAQGPSDHRRPPPFVRPDAGFDASPPTSHVAVANRTTCVVPPHSKILIMSLWPLSPAGRQADFATVNDKLESQLRGQAIASMLDVTVVALPRMECNDA